MVPDETDPLRVGLLSCECATVTQTQKLVVDECRHSHGHGHGGHKQGLVAPDSLCGPSCSGLDTSQDGGSPEPSVTGLASPMLGVGVGNGQGQLVNARHLLDALERSVRWLDAHDPAECKTKAHLAVDCEQARCDHTALSETNNMLLLVRANELITMAHVNTFLAITSVFYLATNLVCAVLNSYDNECDLKTPGCLPATTPTVFHRLEFWATCIFNTVDLLALSYSPRTLSNQYQNPVVLKLLVLFNVGLSFAGALMVTLNLELFEVISHELEYSNELIICIFDSMILLTLARGHGHKQERGDDRFITFVTLLMSFLVALVQLGIYNLSGWHSDGDSKGERPAHYLEFFFGAASAAVTFWFTMDNKMCAEKRLKQIMYGDSHMQW